MTRSATFRRLSSRTRRVQLPDLVHPGRFLRECGLAPFGELAALALIVRFQDQSLVTQQPQHGRPRDPVPVMMGHRPDLPMPPTPDARSHAG